MPRRGKSVFGQVSRLIPSRNGTPQDAASPPTVNDRATSPSGRKPISQTPNIIYELRPGTRVIIQPRDDHPVFPIVIFHLFSLLSRIQGGEGEGERSIGVSIDSMEIYFVKFKETLIVKNCAVILQKIL